MYHFRSERAQIFMYFKCMYFISIVCVNTHDILLVCFVCENCYTWQSASIFIIYIHCIYFSLDPLVYCISLSLILPLFSLVLSRLIQCMHTPTQTFMNISVKCGAGPQTHKHAYTQTHPFIRLRVVRHSFIHTMSTEKLLRRVSERKERTCVTEK